jgi:shikimate kinase
MSQQKNAVILVGMAGVGKTTIGKYLAKQLGYAFLDLDHQIVKHTGQKLHQLIKDIGEDAFVALEGDSFRNLDLTQKVVSPGGSIVYHPELLIQAKDTAVVVFLHDSAKNIRRRISNMETRGIVGIGKQSFEQLYNERLPLYHSVADIVVDMHTTSDKVAIANLLNQLRRCLLAPQKTPLGDTP